MTGNTLLTGKLTLTETQKSLLLWAVDSVSAVDDHNEDIIELRSQIERIGNKHKNKYPFDTLEVGHTFDIPANQIKNFTNFRSYVYQRNRVLGKKFLCHQFDDGSVQVYRQA